MSTSLIHDERAVPRLSRAVQVLIAINAAILLAQWTIVSNADAIALLGFHEGTAQRAAANAITYMFVHFGVWHVALNMFALYTFGPRLEMLMGTRGFVLFYLWCGLGGAVAHLAFVRTGSLVGASAAVLGVMYAYAHEWPDEEVALFGVIPMRVWTMVMLFAVGNVVLGVLDAEAAAGAGAWRVYLAHLGGLGFSWLYLRTPQAASIDRLRQRVSPAPDYQDETPRAIPRTLPRARAQRDEVDEIVAKSKAMASQQRPTTRAIAGTASAPGDVQAEALDRVLDKISSHGIDSLTAAERAVLEDSVRRLRGEG